MSAVTNHAAVLDADAVTLENASPAPSGRGLAFWLKQFRRELWMVGLFSLVANLLMLAPTLYMLQVYDRVLVSQSELTLIALSLITLFFFGLMAFAEILGSELVKSGLATCRSPLVSSRT